MWLIQRLAWRFGSVVEQFTISGFREELDHCDQCFSKHSCPRRPGILTEILLHDPFNMKVPTRPGLWQRVEVSGVPEVEDVPGILHLCVVDVIRPVEDRNLRVEG